METVTVDKQKLREIVAAHKLEHKSDFNDAVEGYRQTVLRDLEDHMNSVKNGSLKRIAINYPVPTDHTSDYNRIINMIDMHLGDTIVISQEDFARYVENDWDWMNQFGTVAASYSGSSKFDRYR